HRDRLAAPRRQDQDQRGGLGAHAGDRGSDERSLHGGRRAGGLPDPRARRRPQGRRDASAELPLRIGPIAKAVERRIAIVLTLSLLVAPVASAQSTTTAL